MPDLNNFFRWLSRFFLPNAIFTLFIVYLVLTYQQATAQIGEKDSIANPPLVTSTFAYQGFLTNAAGQPINGNRALTFRLYSGASGGSALWTEVRNTVTIQNGLFDIRLGEIVPIPNTVWDTPTLYLGVQVETESELTPREPIGLVPVAQRAITADQADLALTVPDGSVTSDKLNLTSERIILTNTINLTDQPQTLISTSINVDYPAQVLIIPSLNFIIGNGAAVGEVFVDNQEQSSDLVTWLLPATSQSYRTTVSHTYIVNLNPGIHTIDIKGRLFPGTDSGSVEAPHSSMTYLVFSQ